AAPKRTILKQRKAKQRFIRAASGSALPGAASRWSAPSRGRRWQTGRRVGLVRRFLGSDEPSGDSSRRLSALRSGRVANSDA
ncbi:MAG: hypothetical protein IKX88_13045, partial [Thermoguttaceae bacterium]|nr:hypothetical protein [Thermoguttaceae bacterium]